MPFSMSLAELILCADTLAAGRDSWKKALLAARHSVWQHLSLMAAIRCNRRYFVAAIADFPVLQNALEKADWLLQRTRLELSDPHRFIFVRDVRFSSFCACSKLGVCRDWHTNRSKVGFLTICRAARPRESWDKQEMTSGSRSNCNFASLGFRRRNLSAIWCAPRPRFR